MQTTRFLVVIGAVATLSASPLPSFANPDNEAQAKLREAMRQKIDALSTPAAPAPVPAPVAPAPVPKIVAPQPVVAPTVVVPVPVEPEPVKAIVSKPVLTAPASSHFSEVSDAGESATEAKLRAALRQKIVEPASASVGATHPAKPVLTPAPAHASTSVVAQPATQVGEPVIAPAFSGSKQDRLAALLQQYKADQITPQQYHAQRAAIIAAP